jgi:hypothetical protein
MYFCIVNQRRFDMTNLIQRIPNEKSHGNSLFFHLIGIGIKNDCLFLNFRL